MAQGSHATLGGWERLTCDYCGQKIVVSRDNCGFEVNHTDGRIYAWHLACGDGPKR
jgi:hypothetical protein